MARLYLVAVLIAATIACGPPSPPSAAQQWATHVTANLDDTTLEQFVAQMPNTQPDSSRNGQDRKMIWTFPDGSQIRATFRPHGGEGSGQGLRLHLVDITPAVK